MFADDISHLEKILKTYQVKIAKDKSEIRGKNYMKSRRKILAGTMFFLRFCFWWIFKNL